MEPHTLRVTERDYATERKEALERILRNGNRLKLIVAGAGTGKTFTFRAALSDNPKENQVLTFIRLLVRDMTPALEAKADVQTFHSYATGVLHQIGANWLGNDFDIYPSLGLLLEREVEILSGSSVPSARVEERMQWLAPDASVEAFLQAGNYYSAAGFVDVVYRLYERLFQNPDLVPEHRQLVVDEVQDFTRLEVSLIQLLAQRSPVLAAGDDDQAIYGWRSASPEFIREMAIGGEWERFELPFCSRCTPVIVGAVHDLIAQAQRQSLFQDRLEKTYECYLPDKAADAERYPRIKAVECSVHRPGAHMPARYVSEQVAAIPSEDIAESHEAGYPTVLIIGPGYLTTPVGQQLGDEGYHVTRRRNLPQPKIDVLAGYRILMGKEYSRLAWRIVLECDPPANLTEILTKAIYENVELRSLIEPAYVEKHLGIAQLLTKLANGKELADDELERLFDATGCSLEALREELGLVTEEAVQLDKTKPTVLVTTFQAAKGLSGGHVFVVGMNEGSLPEQPQVTDEDVRLFLVALTRTRKQCHLMWLRYYGLRRGRPIRRLPSRFVKWLASDRLERVSVDAAYFRRPSRAIRRP